MIFNINDDSNLLFIVLGAIVGFLGLGLAVFGINSWMKRGKKISSRMDQFVASEIPSAKNSTTSQIIPREISGSLLSRTVISWFSNFLNILGRLTPVNMVLDLEHKLKVAGNPAKLHAASFNAIRFLTLLVGIFIAFLINRNFKNITLTSAMLGIMCIIIGLLLPSTWLKGRMRARQDEIRRGLPDALDMLSVCASAGLGFDQSLQKISSYWDTELGRELKLVTQEMEMGVSRASALKARC
jgi:pilus assembly protein TadC